MSKLNNDNFDEYAVSNYINPNCVSVLEFLDDLKIIKYIKRLINKYVDKDELKERLILNHIIVLGNLFGVEPTTKMLFYKLEEKFWPQVKTFLVFLNYMPLKIIVSPGIEILDKDIPIDETILEDLKRI